MVATASAPALSEAEGFLAVGFWPRAFAFPDFQIYKPKANLNYEFALATTARGSDWLTALLIEAVQEQQEQIRALQAEVEGLKKAVVSG